MVIVTNTSLNPAFGKQNCQFIGSLCGEKNLNLYVCKCTYGPKGLSCEVMHILSNRHHYKLIPNTVAVDSKYPGILAMNLNTD